MKKIIYNLTQKRVFGQKYFPCYFIADVCLYSTLVWFVSRLF
jgi:hypothetical protein